MTVVKDRRRDKLRVFRHNYGEQDDSVVPKATDTSFRQPGITSQESDALVFGVGSQAVSRSDLRADLMHDRLTPAVHTHASQTPETDRLVDADGQQADVPDLSRKLSTLDFQRLASSLGEAEKPSTSLPPVLSTPRMTTSNSRLRFAKVAPTVPRNDQPRRPMFDFNGDAAGSELESDRIRTHASRYLPSHQSEQSPSALTHAHHIDATSHVPQTDTPPGTPPYTPNY